MAKDYFEEVTDECDEYKQTRDIVGKVFGEWIVLERVKGGFICRCSCGFEVLKSNYFALVKVSKHCYHCERRKRRERKLIELARIKRIEEIKARVARLQLEQSKKIQESDE